MRRYWLLAIVAGLALGVIAPAQAEWLGNFFHGLHRGFVRNNNWPEPFIRADREAVSAPMAMMVANGWRRENLLHEHHFDPETARLNQAGEMKVWQVTTQAPPQHRTVFVQKAATAGLTQARMESVRKTVLRMEPQTGVVQVVESNLPTDGRSGEEVNAIMVGVIKNQPAPVLPKGDGGAAGGP